jgi:hypothetical protein
MGNLFPQKIPEPKLPDNVSKTDEDGVLVIKDRKGRFRHFLVQKNSGFGKFALSMQYISDTRIRIKEEYFYAQFFPNENLLKFSMNYKEGDIDSVRSDDEDDEEEDEKNENEEENNNNNNFDFGSLFKINILNADDDLQYKIKNSDDEESIGGEYRGINGTDSKSMELLRNRTDKPTYFPPSTTVIKEENEINLKFQSYNSSNNNNYIPKPEPPQKGLNWIIVKNEKMLLLYKLFVKSKENELNIRAYIKNQYETHKHFTTDPKTEVYKDLVDKIPKDDSTILQYQSEVDILLVRISNITKKIDQTLITDQNTLLEIKKVEESIRRISELKCKITDLDYIKKQ